MRGTIAFGLVVYERFKRRCINARSFSTCQPSEKHSSSHIAKNIHSFQLRILISCTTGSLKIMQNVLSNATLQLFFTTSPWPPVPCSTPKLLRQSKPLHIDTISTGVNHWHVQSYRFRYHHLDTMSIPRIIIIASGIYTSSD